MEAYELRELLGEGAHGRVFRAFHTPSGKDCVMKCVSIASLDAIQLELAMNEVSALLAASAHRFIITFFESFVEGQGEQALLCIAMEAADGDLESRIAEQRRYGRGEGFEETQIVDWITQTALALKHMHDKRIIHRDLKPENILLVDNAVRVADFGLTSLQTAQQQQASVACGTPEFMAPEVLSRPTYDGKADVWSLGCILYALCAMHPPFLPDSSDDDSDWGSDAEETGPGGNLVASQTIRNVIESDIPPLPDGVSPALARLYGRLMTRDPETRPTIDEVLCMPPLRKRTRSLLSREEYRREFAVHRLQRKHRSSWLAIEDQQLHEALSPRGEPTTGASGEGQESSEGDDDNDDPDEVSLELWDDDTQSWAPMVARLVQKQGYLYYWPRLPPQVDGEDEDAEESEWMPPDTRDVTTSLGSVNFALVPSPVVACECVLEFDVRSELAHRHLRVRAPSPEEASGWQSQLEALRLEFVATTSPLAIPVAAGGERMHRRSPSRERAIDVLAEAYVRRRTLSGSSPPTLAGGASPESGDDTLPSVIHRRKRAASVRKLMRTSTGSLDTHDPASPLP